jgi:hypothetical protein
MALRGSGCAASRALLRGALPGVPVEYGVHPAACGAAYGEEYKGDAAAWRSVAAVPAKGSCPAVASVPA